MPLFKTTLWKSENMFHVKRSDIMPPQLMKIGINIVKSKSIASWYKFKLGEGLCKVLRLTSFMKHRRLMIFQEVVDPNKSYVTNY